MKHKKIKLTVIFVLILTVLFLTSYGFFYVTTNQNDRNRLAGGCFNPTFTDGDSISIENAFPMTNKEGLETDPYHFTLTNSCTTKVKYYVILNVKNNSFDEKYINVSLNGGEGQRLDTMPNNTLSGTIDSGYTNSYLLKTGMLEQGSITENIRAWLNDSTTYDQIEQESNSGFTAQIKVVGMVGSEYNLATTKIMDLVNGEPTNTTDVITKSAPEGATCTNTLAYDGTTDNNLRYVGSNPCNYVSFNNELWRIIGVMNNMDNGTGKSETRLKIVRNSFLGNYSWDSSDPNTNNGYGMNDWTQSDIMKELNGDYLNSNLSTNTVWYNGQNNQKTGVYNYSNGINKSSQSLIGNTKWYLHLFTNPEVIYTTTLDFYNSERIISSEQNDLPFNWIGKIALIYPSDFGFAVGGTSSNRNSCLQEKVTNYKNGCYSDDWLYNDSSIYWTISVGNSYPGSVISVYTDTGGRSVDTSYYAHYNRSVKPALYLNSSAKITGGDGSEANPYVLG